MIDTINIAQLISKFDHEKLISLGWKVTSTDEEAFLSYKEKKGSAFPYLYLYISPIGQPFLGLVVSLPAFYRGSNAKLLTQNEVIDALEKLSQYVFEKSGIKYDAKTARVWNVDFAIDIYIGEDAMRPIVERLSKIQIPRFCTGSYKETTLYFHSKGIAKQNKKPRTICLYPKKQACMDKNFPQADTQVADGILRCEFRYRDKRAAKRLAEKLDISQIAEELFTDEVAESVLGQIITQIELLRDAPSLRDKIYKLLKAFGERQCRKLISFLINRDAFGADFYKITELGYSKSYYYECERKCRSCGIWSIIDTTQPPLEIGDLP